MPEAIKLKVAEAVQDDVGKGIVRVDSKVIHELGLKPGDIIEIKGEKATVSIIDRAYPGDIGLKIIRMDGLTRRNAKTGIGEYVEIDKVEVKEAKKVIIAPAHQGISVRAPPTLFKQGLLGRAVVKGDLVSLGGARRRRMAMSDSPIFNEIFNIMNDSYQGVGFAGDLKFIVAEAQPKSAVIITEQTEVEFNPTAVSVEEEGSTVDVSYEDIGGLQEEISKIREMVELPLKHPEVFEQLGIEPPKGVLLHGPPGTGKTLLARAVANETNSHFVVVNGPEIMSKFYGESEANLRKIFEDAEKNAPSIIFFDEIDAIATNREDSKGEVERRVVAQLLSIMDGLKSRGKVVVIAATNIPNALDPALRRPGRFDRELEINPPNKEGRLTILKIHTRNMPIMPDYNVSSALNKIQQRIKKTEEQVLILKAKDQSESIKAQIQNKTEFIKVLLSIKAKLQNMTQEAFIENMQAEVDHFDADEKNKLHDVLQEELLEGIAEATHGFVGADLSALARETAMVVLRKVLPEIDLEEEKEIPPEILAKLKIVKDDFIEALKFVRPSALREVLIEVPNVKWDNIGGLDAAKQDLKEAVEWPLNNPESFKRLGIRAPRGILLYGPPGTGKTMMAKAVANESGANFISVKGPELLSKWVGESEKAVRDIFKKARQVAPAIIFFDEIDSLVPRRGNSSDEGSKAIESVVNQLLTEIDGVEEMHDVVIIGATNRPDRLDPALLRPGRFDRLVLIGSPDVKTREEILKLHCKKIPLASDVDLKILAEKLKGYVGADLESVCREAAIRALRKDITTKEVSKIDFDEALEVVRPSITEDIEKAYEQLKNKFSTAKGEEMRKESVNYFG
ncbi:MAG: CDC48 family AAA ATPase [Candidatus Woesearchaeota archaeon]